MWLVVTPFVPLPNATQAGHRLLYEYLCRKSKDDIVHLLVLPNGKEFGTVQKIDISGINLVGTYRFGVFRKITSIILGLFSYAPRFNTRYSKFVSDIILKLCRTHSYAGVRFEFSQSFRYAEDLRKYNPDIYIEFGVIDVQLQVVLRKPLLASFLFSKYTFVSEKRLFRFSDINITVCQKDSEIIRGLYGGGLKCMVSPPQLPEWIARVCRSANTIEPYSCIFRGAMNRTENEDAVFWFVKNVFNKVLSIKGRGILYIVGANPSPKLINLQSNNIVITGYVTDPVQYFQRASVGVIPLRYGAGVKLKTLELLAAGVPIVSTEIGVEGIDFEKRQVVVADDANSFLKAVLKYF
jgi:glycosyltransferase involved in cell wall biosynthesis